MKRKLLTQILNEWRSNIWLALEMLLVSVIVWFMLSGVYAYVARAMLPNCVDTTDTYTVTLTSLPSEAPTFNPADTTSALDATYILVERLRRHPGVEAAALSLLGVPNRGNYMGSAFNTLDAAGDTIENTGVAVLDVTPEWFRVFRVKGINGESSEEMARIIERGEVIVTSNVMYWKKKLYTNELFDTLMRRQFSRIPTDLVGCRIWQDRDTTTRRRVGGIVVPYRRYAYDSPTQSLLVPATREFYGSYSPTIVVRVKEGYADGERFARELAAQGFEHYREGNHFLSGATSIAEQANQVNANAHQTFRTFGIIIVFLLLSVFLGLLGAFWFRTQQRMGEIAVRKVNGATSTDIFRRFIGEGLLLLLSTLPITALLAWLINKAEINMPLYDYLYFDWGLYLLPLAATYLLMALMIVAGVWFPARKAMAIEAAEALKDE